MLKPYKFIAVKHAGKFKLQDGEIQWMALKGGEVHWYDANGSRIDMSRPPIELAPAFVLTCPECGMASMIPAPLPDECECPHCEAVYPVKK